MKSLVILGSTGSIGESALQVVAALPQHFRVVGLAAHNNVQRLIEQARLFNVKTVAVADAQAAQTAQNLARPYGIEVWPGDAGVAALAALPGSNLTLCALVGLAGLQPVLSALQAGHDVALATKEVLVAAGGLVMATRQAQGARLLPIDSEHSALFQCLQAREALPACVRQPHDTTPSEASIARLFLTASGGPFANHPQLDFATVTVAQALAHPRWEMGQKVTIDSATMMNKGLEVLEAHWLFNLPLAQIEVVLHPESIVHSLVEFVDGSQLAQLSQPDMRFPIQYALSWPERHAVTMPRLDLARLGSLSFASPDAQRFPCLALAREAGVQGGTMPAVLNATDEVAVAAFLARRIKFSDIWRIVEQVMARHNRVAQPDLATILDVDTWARQQAQALCATP